ncbi:hypothetical protein GT037_009512 [Alternaria burnsii]|uniref:G domain-containing protein n=1 Tax=Alternaria burnsii TaxID=1187904 RepID=A0A8H7ECF0_9PLEO|nr:uncharacterized protein GT037_009512 [Alternaria burnsii]KAF7672481.1 hypothetical protein GT037_009512 [Alternaria burnsii]
MSTYRSSSTRRGSFDVPDSARSSGKPSTSLPSSALTVTALNNNAPSSQAIGILVMGLTGAGKSTFISQVTQKSADIGHSLESCTTDVTFRTLQRKNGQEIYLIDTPGFDDTKLEYAAVFRKIASWICTYCDGNRRGLRIGGMIYVQRITDMRMSGSSLKSLRIFEKICGERNFRDVVVVTTMWGSLKTNEARDAAVMRMKMMEERPEFFGNLIRGGARMEKSQGDGQNGVRIVELLADRRKTVVLQLQHEMRGGMKLEGTTAGRYLEGELVHTRERYEAQKRELEECAEEVHDDDDLRSEFLEQIEDCTRLVNNIVDDQGSLSVTLEDMWNEQAVSCGAGRDDQAEDATQENTSAHIVKLEHKIQGLERKIEAQRDDLDAQREEIERIEAASKEIAEAKERDQVARTKVKERRAPHNEAILWMQNFFAGRRPENFVQPPRRADSMPLETKASRKSSITSWQKRSRSKSRQSRKPDNMRTYSEEQTKQLFFFINCINTIAAMKDRVDSPHREVPVIPDLKPDDIIIAVMGITGCGKTTFVNLFSDRKLEVGHGLDSCTVSVQVVPCTFEGGAKIYLVDTPGFDDTYRTDSEILREVALWLNKAHSEKLRLAGIIFLQRISDVRVGGSGIKNIRMFQKLCGDGPLASVVLATTMWDMATKDAAIQREKELKEQPQLWKKMIDHGSVVFRHDKKEASALKIIKYLMKKKRPVTLDIQREMVDEKRELIDTGAGEALASNMEALIKLYEGKLRNLEQEFREARKEDREMLEEQKREHEESLAKQRREMEKLHVNRLQLIEEEKKRFEESQREAKEEMQRVKENFAAELGKQKKHIREQYIREMQRCNVM